MVVSGHKNYETTKARNLKFGQMIGLYMDLRPCKFGGATLSGLGHMHPKSGQLPPTFQNYFTALNNIHVKPTRATSSHNFFVPFF